MEFRARDAAGNVSTTVGRTVVTRLLDAQTLGSTELTSLTADGRAVELKDGADEVEVGYDPAAGYPNVAASGEPRAQVQVSQASADSDGVATVQVVSADGLYHRSVAVRFTEQAPQPGGDQPGTPGQGGDQGDQGGAGGSGAGSTGPENTTAARGDETELSRTGVDAALPAFAAAAMIGAAVTALAIRRRLRR